MSARLVDLCDRPRQRRAFSVRDFLQVTPEGIFKADAGLVSINYDGTFERSWRISSGHPHSPRLVSYRVSELRRSNLIPPRSASPNL